MPRGVVVASLDAHLGGVEVRVARTFERLCQVSPSGGEPLLGVEPALRGVGERLGRRRLFCTGAGMGSGLCRARTCCGRAGDRVVAFFRFGGLDAEWAGGAASAQTLGNRLKTGGI